MMKKINYLTGLPADFLNYDPRDFYKVFSEPTVIEIEGIQKQPIFISTLLHGNEYSGVYALQNLFKTYAVANTNLPRSVILFIGNVEAARENLRHLDGQMDFNRIWGEGDTTFHHIAKEVKQFVASKNPFACIDIHNNTGWNPHYACVNQLENHFLNLAKIFSRRIVYFVKPKEVLTIAFNAFTTAVTLECGQSGDLSGIQRCVDFLEQVLALDTLDDSPVSNDDVTVYHSVVTLKIPETSSIGFGRDTQKDIVFVPNFECLNFMELQEHALLGWRKNANHELLVFDENGNNVASEFITYENNEIRTKRPTVPSMFNENETIIRQDCLGYFMQRYQL